MDACDLYGPNRWPADLPELRSVIHEYWAACDRAAAPIMAAYADGLGVDPDVFARWHDTPLTNMTLLHYPATACERRNGDSSPQGRECHHPAAPGDVPGLDAVRDGEWITPDAAMTLVVNVGECSNCGREVSTSLRRIGS